MATEIIRVGPALERVRVTSRVPRTVTRYTSRSAGTGGGGVSLHAELTDTDTDGHPISAIPGLQAALDAAGGEGVYPVAAVRTNTAMTVTGGEFDFTGFGPLPEGSVLNVVGQATAANNGLYAADATGTHFVATADQPYRVERIGWLIPVNFDATTSTFGTLYQMASSDGSTVSDAMANSAAVTAAFTAADVATKAATLADPRILPSPAGKADGLTAQILAEEWVVGPAVNHGLWFNVMTYGAVGDGVTDDTDAFEATLAAAAVDGGTVFVPEMRFLIRRRLTIPSGVMLRGAGSGSVITKASAVSHALTESPTSGDLTVTVASTTGLAVGDEVTVSDDGNLEWNSTHALIESLTETTVTLDRTLISSYNAGAGGAIIYTGFPLVTNHASPNNTPLNPPTFNIVVKDLTLDQNAGPDDPNDEFTNAIVHWEHTFDSVVDNCWLINAAGDAYSDQGRNPDAVLGVGTPTANIIHNCSIRNPGRHGIHFGTTSSGARATGNHVYDCANMGVFLCAHAQDVLIQGNTFRNCFQGVAGADVRLADDSAPTAATDPLLLRGDIHTLVVGNQFIGGALNDDTDSLWAIELGAFSAAVGNTISHWNGGIHLVASATDCVVDGNTIDLTPNTNRVGIQLTDGNHRARITNTGVRGTGAGVTGGVIAVNGTADDVLISGLSGFRCAVGWSFGGDMSNLMVTDCQLREIADPWGMVRIYGTLTDSSLDLTGVDPAGSVATDIISYNDGVGAAAQVRLRINGVGDNGATDPATSGQWSTANVERYAGVEVVWDDGTPHVSMLVDGVWVDLTAGGGASVAPRSVQVFAATGWSAQNGGVARTADSGSLFGGWLDLSAGSAAGWVEWDVWLDAGTWSIDAICPKGAANGVGKLQIDGVDLGTWDQYAASTTRNTVTTFTGITIATAGHHTLRVALVSVGTGTGWTYRVQALNLNRTGA